MRSEDPSSSVGLHRGKFEGAEIDPIDMPSAGIIIVAQQAGEKPKGFDSCGFYESLC